MQIPTLTIISLAESFNLRLMEWKRVTFNHLTCHFANIYICTTVAGSDSDLDSDSDCDGERAKSEIQIQFKIHFKQQSKLCIQGISSDGKNVRFQVVYHINLHFALFTKPLREQTEK